MHKENRASMIFPITSVKASEKNYYNFMIVHPTIFKTKMCIATDAHEHQKKTYAIQIGNQR